MGPSSTADDACYSIAPEMEGMGGMCLAVPSDAGPTASPPWREVARHATSREGMSGLRMSATVPVYTRSTALPPRSCVNDLSAAYGDDKCKTPLAIWPVEPCTETLLSCPRHCAGLGGQARALLRQLAGRYRALVL